MAPGNCQICGGWKRDLAACPRCGQMIGLCCWVFSETCCVQCHYDQHDDHEDISEDSIA